LLEYVAHRRIRTYDQGIAGINALNGFQTQIQLSNQFITPCSFLTNEILIIALV